MNEKVAKGIAANIRIITENTARIAIIDAGGHVTQVATCDRVDCTRAIEKAQGTIAQWLMQPGALQ